MKYIKVQQPVDYLLLTGIKVFLKLYLQSCEKEIRSIEMVDLTYVNRQLNLTRVSTDTGDILDKLHEIDMLYSFS